MTSLNSAEPGTASTQWARGEGREARLRCEYAHHYPGVRPGHWECAATLADRVLAACLLRGRGLSLHGRPLSDQHFEFRGGTSPRRGVAGGPRREDR